MLKYHQRLVFSVTRTARPFQASYDEVSTSAGYLVYPFQNQEIHSRAGNLSAIYLVRRLHKKHW